MYGARNACRGLYRRGLDFGEADDLLEEGVDKEGQKSGESTNGSP